MYSSPPASALSGSGTSDCTGTSDSSTNMPASRARMHT